MKNNIVRILIVIVFHFDNVLRTFLRDISKGINYSYFTLVSFVFNHYRNDYSFS